jgi:hypothetical protein
MERMNMIYQNTKQHAMNQNTHEGKNRFADISAFSPMTTRDPKGADGDTFRWFSTEAYAYARMLNMAGFKIEAIKCVYDGVGYWVDAHTSYDRFARVCGASYEDAGWLVSWTGEKGHHRSGWFRVIMGNGAGEWFSDGSMGVFAHYNAWRNKHEAIVRNVENMAHHTSGLPKQNRVAVIDALLDAIEQEVA